MYSITAKETTNKMKRRLTEWEKIFTNIATDKGLVPKIYKQLMQLNIQKQNKQKTKQNKTNQKMGKGLPWWHTG